MTIREELKRAVIEAIHGLPYDKAIAIEYRKGEGCLYDEKCKTNHGIIGKPITIERVMQALKVKCCNVAYHPLDDYFTVKKSSEEKAFSIDWELDKKTDDDQSDKTIKKLLSVFK